MKKSSLLKLSVYISGLNIIGKMLGYLIPFFIASFFGVNSNIDVFFYAYGLIFFLAMIFSSTMESIIVPIISELNHDEDIKFKDNFVFEACLYLFIALSFCLVIFYFLFPLLQLITQFSSLQLKLLKTFYVEFCPFVFFLCYSALFSGILNANKLFWAPAIAPGLRAVIAIVTMVTLKNRFELHSIIFAYTFGELIRLLFLISLVYQKQFIKIKTSFSFNKRTMELFKNAMFMILGTVVVGLNPIIDNTFASWLSEGSISLVEYSSKIVAVPYNLLAFGLFVVFLSHLSETLHSKGIESFRQTITSYIKPISLISFIISLGIIFYSDIITNLFFSFADIKQQDINTVKNLTIITMIGFTPYMIIQTYIRGFIALKETKYLLWISCWKVCLNIIFDLIFVPQWGIYGIKIASTTLDIVLLIVVITYFKKMMNKKGYATSKS